ncbi:daunorubicin resistance protein DrrA family ABC transporter ATP-binding protein [Acrocarpospora macrocephala]|uniref:Daunorubicin resistance protein DrrA family ABC transporter ATP-binding protein n=1 Tax=Acrocarpospora macrocephala TaxID=150177 RepID=A0A5M3WUQ2_9ACTN|nr:ABC transporter ATP-binding protein [Acrocarpospora macrocephala]GES11719.1 daunorubicin resistance protein DrrA family ABC transporter ATP-binding protein [Acrocarpospora macrocephala]
MLQAIDLVKRYGSVLALDGFSLSVAAGEIVGLVGHNGAGKTTFVEIVSYLIRQDSGHVTIDGRPPSASKGQVGVAPQHIALYPSITVREHLVLFGKLAGLRRTALDSAIEDLTVALRLGAFIDRKTAGLSGGQQRRVQAATALIHRPGLLLLDEPTAGADLETREAMLDVVKQRAGDGAAIVYTTHYLPELVELQATIAVARNGKIIARGTYDELVEGLPGEVCLIHDNEEEVRVSTTQPAATLIDLLSRAERPISTIEVHNPSLDDLYRSLAVSDAS